MSFGFKHIHAGSAQQRTAVVFVHGILSNCEKCFTKMQADILQADNKGNLDVWHYDYDYHRAITDNGERLAEHIQTTLSDTHDYARIQIVAHSMGGLVARIALMHRKLTRVERLILLGTPNHGAFTAHQLTLLGQLVRASTNWTSALFPRKRGIVDLSNAPRIMGDYAKHHVMQTPAKLEDRQKHYISIPALFYHPNRCATDVPPSLLMWGAQAGIAAFMRKVGKLTPPHDGIVEAVSNRLHPRASGSEPEILYLVNIPDLKDIAPYIEHVEAEQEDHVTMTKADAIIKLVHALLIAPSVEKGDVLATLSATFPNERVFPHRIQFNP